MADIQPFRALRPKLAFAKQVASPPYDVLSSAEAKKEAEGKPYSFLHITKSEIDLPENIDTHSQEVYDKAKQNLDHFIHDGVLARDAKPCYYIYQLVMNQKSQTGLVCVSSINDYEKGIIKKHELTRPDKELDRINHIKTTGAQTGNVFLAYKSEESIHKTIEDWKASHHPEYDFAAPDGIQHIIWVLDDPATIDRLTNSFQSKVPFTYIADGHHRAASAAKVRAALGAAAGPGSNYFLTTLFPSDQLHILDYNRVVKDMNGLTEEELLSLIGKDFLVGKVDHSFSPQRLHEFGLYMNGNWYELVAK
ncbi:MAG TPA: DUF1015 domain-containing protein, partial [Puia sp.]|nr:DUF1015 domain-containing protein [Puia sp.]